MRKRKAPAVPDSTVMLSVQPLEHVVAARGRHGTGADRAALEALTDEGLAQMAGVRRAVASGELDGPLTVPVAKAAEVFAAELRLEFPGRDKETARVLAAAAAKLDAAGERLADAGLEPDETAMALLALLSLAAAGLNQEGTSR